MTYLVLSAYVADHDPLSAGDSMGSETPGRREASPAHHVTFDVAKSTNAGITQTLRQLNLGEIADYVDDVVDKARS